MGYKIKERRKKLKMSQVELDRKDNVSETVISGFESGEINVITTETLLKLAEVLNTKINNIFWLFIQHVG